MSGITVGICPEGELPKPLFSPIQFPVDTPEPSESGEESYVDVGGQEEVYEKYEIACDSEPESPPAVIEGITEYLVDSDISILILLSDSDVEPISPERPTYSPITVGRFDTSTPICDHTNTGGIASASDALARDQSMEIENGDDTSLSETVTQLARQVQEVSRSLRRRSSTPKEW